MKALIALTVVTIYPSCALAANQEIDSFNKAKRLLETQVYNDHRTTIYCGAEFGPDKKVRPPKGFTTTKYINRSKKN